METVGVKVLTSDDDDMVMDDMIVMMIIIMIMADVFGSGASPSPAHCCR